MRCAYSIGRCDRQQWQHQALSFEPCDHLDMRRITKLIDWRDRCQPITAADKFGYIARERRRVAGDCDDYRYAACR